MVAPFPHQVPRTWSQRFDFGDCPPPVRSDVRNCLRVLLDNAPGPDCIPHLAWRSCGEDGVATLQNVCAWLAEGNRPPNWFNQSIMFSGPKVKRMMTQTLMLLEMCLLHVPFSLNNPDKKIVCSVTNFKLSGAVAKASHKIQQGFVKGRRLLANVVDLDVHACCSSNEDDWSTTPLLVFYDFAAAFPSVFHCRIVLAFTYIGCPIGLISIIGGLSP